MAGTNVDLARCTLLDSILCYKVCRNRSNCQLCFIPSSSSQEDSQFFNQSEAMAATLNVRQGHNLEEEHLRLV